MADDVAPVGDINASSDEFYEIAKSTGEKMKNILQDRRDRAGDNAGFIKFEINDHVEVLQTIMDQSQVSCDNAARARNHVA